MQKHYLVMMAGENSPQKVLVRHGYDEESIQREIVEEHELDAEDWTFEFIPLEEGQARAAESDPEYYYMTKFG